jgi:hypothetical protein
MKWAVILLLLSLSLCTKVFATYERSMLRNPSSWERELHDDQTCLETLWSVSDDGEVDGIQFLLFLDVISGGNVKFDDFHQLPLDLRLVFYAAACSGGRECTSGLAAISLDPSVHSSILLKAFCMQIAEILDEGDYLKISFRYILYHEESLTPEEILAGADGNEIVSILESATERVVRNALGCPEASKETTGFEKRSDLQIYPIHADGSRLLQRVHVAKTQKSSFLEPPIVKVVGSRQLQECDYAIEAKVNELFAYSEYWSFIRYLTKDIISQLLFIVFLCT